MDRRALRQTLRQRRRALSDDEQALASKEVVEQLKAIPEYINSQTVALYLASDGEISPDKVAQHAWSLGKACYLPVLDNQKRDTMHFQLYTPDSPMTLNRFGITEPVLNQSLCIDPEALDIVLMPLTGFDDQGRRLGMGGGFYDRTFAFLKTQKKPALFGLAHDCQKVDNIPVEEWDIPMTGVVTATRIY